MIKILKNIDKMLLNMCFRLLKCCYGHGGQSSEPWVSDVGIGSTSGSTMFKIPAPGLRSVDGRMHTLLL